MFSKSVNDAGWSIFLNMLRFKAEWAGSRVVGVDLDPAFTSQACLECGTTRKKALSARWHKCDESAIACHRDVAAAQVILARGLASHLSNPWKPMPCKARGVVTFLVRLSLDCANKLAYNLFT